MQLIEKSFLDPSDSLISEMIVLNWKLSLKMAKIVIHESGTSQSHLQNS